MESKNDKQDEKKDKDNQPARDDGVVRSKSEDHIVTVRVTGSEDRDIW